MSMPEPHSALATRFCELVGVRYPIVQTGMGGVASSRLVTATANAGGLGILASTTMTLDELKHQIADVRAQTDAPFGVNFRTDVADIDQRIAVMVDAVKVASFAQAPRADLVVQCKEASLVVMPTVGARRRAEKVAALGVDAVIAQGSEGGGHTGLVPTTLLTADVVDAVGSDVCVISAGGWSSGAGLVAALALSADAIAMGTRFLLTSDSTVPDEIKQQYFATPLTGTVVSTKIDGAPQRAVRTELVDKLEKSSWLSNLPQPLRSAHQFRSESGASLWSLLKEGRTLKAGNDLTWPQIVMAANAPVMTKAGLVDGRLDVGVLPTGQVTGVINEVISVETLIAQVITDANATIDRLSEAEKS